MASKNCCVHHSHVVRTINPNDFNQEERKLSSDDWRRACGCLRTSDKLKEILKTFPAPPPPSPVYEKSYVPANFQKSEEPTCKDDEPCKNEPQMPSKSRLLMYDLVRLLQLTVTIMALAFYYLIYCYMQVIYYTLQSVLYFHHADGPMKITIAVVTLTSLIVAFNLIIRMQKIIGIC